MLETLVPNIDSLSLGYAINVWSVEARLLPISNIRGPMGFPLYSLHSRSGRYKYIHTWHISWGCQNTLFFTVYDIVWCKHYLFNIMHKHLLDILQIGNVTSTMETFTNNRVLNTITIFSCTASYTMTSCSAPIRCVTLKDMTSLSSCSWHIISKWLITFVRVICCLKT